MTRSEKKIRDFEEKLKSRDRRILLKAIRLLREEEPWEGAVGMLAELYDETDDLSVRKAVQDFMNDLKDKSAGREVIEEMKKKHKTQTICMLASSCWQSGLDYSGYLNDFAGIFVSSDLEVAIECYTVIKESAGRVSVKARNEVSDILIDAAPSLSEEKAALANDLIMSFRKKA
ncbi:MAG: hypothetical protein HPY62_03270 [Bacteroidales bacterium]|nr:hypothetical protein [Bacteroidales bacterium]